MNFQETKQFLYENIESIAMLTSFRSEDIKNILSSICDTTERAMREDLSDIAISDNDDLITSINRMISRMNDFFLQNPYSDFEIEIAHALVILILNFKDACEENHINSNIKNREIRLLNCLISFKRTLQDEIIILGKILKRISDSISVDVPSELLARNYMEEYMKYLKTKSHDDIYNGD